MASDLADFGKGIELAIAGLVPPDERRVQIQAAADELLEKTQQEIRGAGGATPRHKMLADGQPVQSLDRINPDRGTITFAFASGAPVEVVQAVFDMVKANSPVLTGQYRDSHRVFADDRDVTSAMPIGPEQAEKVDRWTIMPTVEYARKLEEQRKRRGVSGVYEGVAAIAGQRFGNQAEVGYGYESPILPYVAGEFGRGRRARYAKQPSRLKAMRAERETRVPVITIVAVGRA